MENNWFLKIEFLEKSLESAEEENRKLREEIEGWKSANDINLQMFEEEIERLKEILNVAWEKAYDAGANDPINSFDNCRRKLEGFKEENNLNN